MVMQMVIRPLVPMAKYVGDPTSNATPDFESFQAFMARVIMQICQIDE
jgi:hypothetical protein